MFIVHRNSIRYHVVTGQSQQFRQPLDLLGVQRPRRTSASRRHRLSLDAPIYGRGGLVILPLSSTPVSRRQRRQVRSTARLDIGCRRSRAFRDVIGAKECRQERQRRRRKRIRQPRSVIDNIHFPSPSPSCHVDLLDPVLLLFPVRVARRRLGRQWRWRESGRRRGSASTPSTSAVPRGRSRPAAVQQYRNFGDLRIVYATASGM